jgi:hypothetical protein
MTRINCDRPPEIAKQHCYSLAGVISARSSAKAQNERESGCAGRDAPLSRGSTPR